MRNDVFVNIGCSFFVHVTDSTGAVMKEMVPTIIILLVR
jgi:hypothetical protein